MAILPGIGGVVKSIEPVEDPYFKRRIVLTTPFRYPNYVGGSYLKVEGDLILMSTLEDDSEKHEKRRAVVGQKQSFYAFQRGDLGSNVWEEEW